MKHYLTEAVDLVTTIYVTPEKILEFVKKEAQPTIYEKNNLPLNVRVAYCEIIEKYQQIIHYENGNISKEDLIKILTDDTTRT